LITTPFTFPSFAKINWILRILGKRPDGYHEVVTILQTMTSVTADTNNKVAVGEFYKIARLMTTAGGRRSEAELERRDLASSARPGEAGRGAGEDRAVDRLRRPPRRCHLPRGRVVWKVRRRHRVRVRIVLRGQPPVIPVGIGVPREEERPGERDELDRDGQCEDDRQRAAASAQDNQRAQVGREGAGRGNEEGDRGQIAPLWRAGAERRTWPGRGHHCEPEQAGDGASEDRGLHAANDRC